LADKVGITRQSIGYKLKENSFTANELLRIAKVLGIDLNELKDMV
jgi:DNA-binding XRE family transcriptional regulator